VSVFRTTLRVRLTSRITIPMKTITVPNAVSSFNL
jgi:hypothetical protein